MKNKLQIFLAMVVPSLLFSKAVIVMKNEGFSDSERIEEISESLNMVLSSKFQKEVFERVEEESGIAFGGELSSYCYVAYDPFHRRLTVHGRDDFPEIFERVFAEEFVISRLNARTSEIFTKGELIRKEIKSLEGRKLSKDMTTEGHVELEKRIATRRIDLKNTLLSVDGVLSGWVIVEHTNRVSTLPSRERNEADMSARPQKDDDGKEGYFSLSKLSSKNGTPLFVQEIDSEEISEIHYYPSPEDQNRFLMYCVKGESVVGTGWIRLDDDNPLKKIIHENQTTQTTQ